MRCHGAARVTGRRSPAPAPPRSPSGAGAAPNSRVHRDRPPRRSRHRRSAPRCGAPVPRTVRRTRAASPKFAAASRRTLSKAASTSSGPSQRRSPIPPPPADALNIKGNPMFSAAATCRFHIVEQPTARHQRDAGPSGEFTSDVLRTELADLLGRRDRGRRSRPLHSPPRTRPTPTGSRSPDGSHLPRCRSRPG